MRLFRFFSLIVSRPSSLIAFSIWQYFPHLIKHSKYTKVDFKTNVNFCVYLVFYTIE